MKTGTLVFLLVLLAFSVGAPVAVYQRGQARMKQIKQKISAQVPPLDTLSSSRQSTFRETNSFERLSAAETSELARLRNEYRQLRELLNQRSRLEREKRRIEQAMKDLPQQTEPDNPTALLIDELPKRRARITALREWLAENPAQKIPELQFLPEDSWIRSADHERVTDEDFELWMSAQRGNAEARFGRLAQKALKDYAAAHNGGFPADLQSLTPFFSTNIDNSILDRYQIVSTKTLSKSLAEVGGDWAITQKAPINLKHDSRLAISLTGRSATLAEGRWDPTSEE